MKENTANLSGDLVVIKRIIENIKNAKYSEIEYLTRENVNELSIRALCFLFRALRSRGSWYQRNPKR